jgi:hypothetical protein
MLVHKTVTLTAAGTSLAALLGLTAAQDVPLQSLSLQPDGGNGNPVFIGDAGVTTTDWGMRLAAAAGGVPPVPQNFSWYGRPVKLSEIYAVGTAGEKLHVCAFAY